MADDIGYDIDKLNEILGDKAYEERATEFFPHRSSNGDPLVTGYNYVFFTCPRLSLLRSQFNSVAQKDRDELYKNNCRILGLPMEDNDSIYDSYTITALAGGAGLYKFIPLLTNSAIKYSAADEKLDTMDYAETWNKFKIVIGTSNQDSRLAGTFQLEFLEDNDLHIMKFHKLWANYVEKIFIGDAISVAALKALGSDQSGAFTTGVIDYMSSMYHFSVMPDGRTLQYWCKYTGVFPTTNPYSIFTTDDGSVNLVHSVPIEYQYSFKEEMKIHILEDFNIVSSGAATKFTPGDTNVRYFDQSAVKLREISEFPRIVKENRSDVNNARILGRRNAFVLDFGNK